MTSAWSITESVNPPRAAFLDYPLGHTSGKRNEPVLQDEILRRALLCFEELEQPSSIVDLGYSWAEDDRWKDRVMRVDPDQGEGDNRSERNPVPQYQSAEDERLYLEAGECRGCVFYEGEA